MAPVVINRKLSVRPTEELTDRKPSIKTIETPVERKESIKSDTTDKKSSIESTAVAAEYPDEHNPFADDFESETKVVPPPMDKPVSETKIEKKEDKPADIQYVKQQEPLQNAEATELARATKAVVTYYDDENNLINQYNLAKNNQSDKLGNLVDLEPNLNDLNNTNEILNDIKFIDDSFELVDTEAASNLQALEINNAQQESMVAESLNYLAETYYKNDFDRFFSDPSSPYDPDLYGNEFRHIAETRESIRGSKQFNKKQKK